MSQSRRERAETYLRLYGGVEKLKERLDVAAEALVALVGRVEEGWRESRDVDDVYAALVAMLPCFPPEALSPHAVRGSVGETPRVTEIDSEEVTTPLGAKLLLTAALFPRHTSTADLLDGLPPRETIAAKLQYFVDDIRTELLPRWKAFQRHQSQDSDIAAATPAFEERRREAERLKGMFVLLGESEIPQLLLDRCLPCILFCLDDYDPRIAASGAETLDTVLERSAAGAVESWAQVLEHALKDRLLSAEGELWKALLSTACSFCQKRLGGSALSLLTAMVERLQTDAAPYEMGEAFALAARPVVDAAGRSVVRLFSKLFPLVAQWLLFGKGALKLKALDFLKCAVSTGADRMPRHKDIVLELLDAVDTQQTEAEALRAKIQEVRRHVEEIALMKLNENNDTSDG